MYNKISDFELGKAVWNNDCETAEKMLNSGKCDVNLVVENGDTLLIEVVQKGYIKMAHLLLKKGANVNARNASNKTAMMYACRTGDIDMVRLLISFGAHMSESAAAEALISATLANQYYVIKYLLDEMKVDVNSRAQDGRTAFSHACESGSWTAVYFLYTYQADLTLADNNNMTPLMYATLSHHTNVVAFLLEKKVDVNCKTIDKGRTALSIACETGHCAIVRILLQNKADVKHTVEGNSMTKLAFDKNNSEVFIFLMSYLGQCDYISGQPEEKTSQKI